MERARVAALAAMIQLGLLVTPAAANAATGLNTLPNLALPGAGHLLAPQRAHRLPAFVDPFSLRGPARVALASPHHLLANHHRIIQGPRLPSHTRRALQKRLARILPHYSSLFRRAAQDYRLPASLLAAQAYIESKWRPGARYRGAAGLMMLTRRTARVVGVHNRLSPAQSVRGGARYLSRLRAAISPEVPYPDRDLFALAAYNMGPAHLRDARVLARRLGLNPNLWSDMRQVLPLMTKRRYYKTLPHGYVRGRMVVRYVDRILRYQAVIQPHLR